MEPVEGQFTSGLEAIVEFLYRSENINHADVVYMNFTTDTGIFESNGSDIYLEFADKQKIKIAKILFRLQESESIVHHWVKQFAREFGAIIEVFET